MAKKKAFVLYADMRDRMAMLNNEEAGILFKAILDYAADGRPLSTNNRLLEYAFSEIKQQLDRDADKYEEKRLKRAEAGAKGARMRWQNMANANEDMANANEDMANVSNDSKGIAKMADNVTDKDKGNVTDTDKDKGNGNVRKPIGYNYNFSFIEEPFKEPFYKWLEYKRDRRQSYKSQLAIEAAYKKLVGLSNGSGVKALAVVENSMANNYSGLVAPNVRKNVASTSHATDKLSENYEAWKRR